jgi:hypothetical protein
LVTPKTDQLGVECTLSGVAGDSSSSQSFALVRLCIGGYVLGTLDDATYLPTFKAGLIRMVQAPFAGARELACLSSGHWQPGMFGDDVDGRYLVSLGETFDDFLILACRVESRLVILWALLEDPAFEYPGMVAGVPHRCEVSLNDAETAVQDFLQLL